MENRDRDKMSQGNNPISKDKSKSDTSTNFGQNIGRSEDRLNEPISKQSGSVGSGGMKSGSKVGGSSDLDKSSDLGSSSDSSWSDKDKGSLGSE